MIFVRTGKRTRHPITENVPPVGPFNALFLVIFGPYHADKIASPIVVVRTYSVETFQKVDWSDDKILLHSISSYVPSDFLFLIDSVESIETPLEITFLTSLLLESISRVILFHTTTDTVPVVPVKFAESTALVFGTNDTMVVPPGIPVPVIVAPFAHPVVSATVIFGLPFVAQMF